MTREQVIGYALRRGYTVVDCEGLVVVDPVTGERFPCRTTAAVRRMIDRLEAAAVQS
jgi:hypothetical protein